MKLHFINLFALLVLSCNSFQTQKTLSIICFDKGYSKKIEKVLIDDVERIKKLNGAFVEVEGFFHYIFEDVALYPSRYSNSKEALWVEFSIQQNISDSLIENFDNKRVSITARVNILSEGHLNAYMATLDSVICIKEIK